MITGIGIGIGFGRSVAAEERKARSIPVPGAVVIAPLTQSWRNYGSAGGEFTRIGSPTVSSVGASFDGSSQGAYLVTGNSADFTVIARVKMRALGGQYRAQLSAMQQLAASRGCSSVADTSSIYWSFAALGQVPIRSTIPIDFNSHVISLVRSAGVTNMYVDGVVAVSSAMGDYTGTILALAQYLPADSVGSRSNCIITNPAQYHSALSNTNRALVEAWAAA